MPRPPNISKRVKEMELPENLFPISYNKKKEVDYSSLEKHGV